MIHVRLRALFDLYCLRKLAVIHYGDEFIVDDTGESLGSNGFLHRTTKRLGVNFVIDRSLSLVESVLNVIF